MTSSDLSSRQERAAERVLEDETLAGDLTDDSASALINWASDQASELAGDANRNDAQVDDAISALRIAVRDAANSGETDGQKLVAQATAALASALGEQPTPQEAPATPASPTPTPPPQEMPEKPVPQEVPPTPQEMPEKPTPQEMPEKPVPQEVPATPASPPPTPVPQEMPATPTPQEAPASPVSEVSARTQVEQSAAHASAPPQYVSVPAPPAATTSAHASAKTTTDAVIKPGARQTSAKPTASTKPKQTNRRSKRKKAKGKR